MEPKFQTSFIPKNPIGDVPMQRMAAAGFKAPRTVSLLSLTAIILFTLSLLAAGVLFAYDHALNSTISSSTQALVQAENSFDPQGTDNILAASDKIAVAKQLLAKHSAFSYLLVDLQNSFIPNVSLSSLTIALSPDASLTIDAEGTALSYAEAAHEADILASAAYFQNQSFSKLGLTDRGGVSFSFAAGVDPSVVLYERASTNAAINQPAGPAPFFASPQSQGQTSTTTQ